MSVPAILLLGGFSRDYRQSGKQAHPIAFRVLRESLGKESASSLAESSWEFESPDECTSLSSGEIFLLDQ